MDATPSHRSRTKTEIAKCLRGTQESRLRRMASRYVLSLEPEHLAGDLEAIVHELAHNLIAGGLKELHKPKTSTPSQQVGWISYLILTQHPHECSMG